MKKSLLVWVVLVVIALCFVGCCYYNTPHHCKECSLSKQHCPPGQTRKACPANDNDETEETVTIEAVEVVPITPAPADGKMKTNVEKHSKDAAHTAPAAAVPAAK